MKKANSINNLRNQMKKNLLDEKANKKIVGIYTYIALGAVALIMTAINIVTDEGFLTYSTGVFAALCAINVFLVCVIPHGTQIASVLFSIEILLLFTFFLITGNPDGFSALWICMLPSLGMFFFGRKYGALVCGVMFAELIFLLWTPYGKDLLQYNYTDTFCMRFPVLFVAFFVVAVLLEVLRFYTYAEMVNLERRYLELSIRDPLTGMFNRQGLYGELKKLYSATHTREMCFVMVDIDHFKYINDSLGHAAGDTALIEFASLVREIIGDNVCRWGGEEFLIYSSDSVATTAAVEKLRHTLENASFKYGESELHFTVSAGIRYEDNYDVSLLDICIQEADKALYEAKQTGRNKIVVFDPSMSA